MQLVLDSSSDYDDDEFFLSSTHMAMNADESDNETKQCGSIKGHRVLQRDRQAGYQRLYQDYFSDNPTYGHYYFRRRYVTLLILFIRYFKNINSTYMCFYFHMQVSNETFIICTYLESRRTT
jgi:hypothetical protein